MRGKGIRRAALYKEETSRLPPGATLVLYTDGLIDRRTRADGRGTTREAETVLMLQQAVARGAASGDADRSATAAEYAVPGDIDDDMAIFVVRSSPSELASSRAHLPGRADHGLRGPAAGRRDVPAWGMDSGQAELACLLVSEVVTNVVLHASVTPSPGRERYFDMEPLMMPAPVGAAAGPAGRPVRLGTVQVGTVQVGTVQVGTVQVGTVQVGTGPARAPSRSSGRPAAARKAAVPAQAAPVASGAAAWPDALPEVTPDTADPGPREFAIRLRRGSTSVWVEVFDPDLRLPRIRTAGETDEGGRGLYLVDQLATRWGSRPTPEGKAVWFEMPRSGGGS